MSHVIYCHFKYQIIGHELNNWNGVQAPRLRSTDYNTFLDKGINDQTDFEMATGLEVIYNLQSIVENLDKTIFEEAATDNTFTVLTKIRHKFGIYGEILPQLLLSYQHQGKKILHEYQIFQTQF